MNLQLVRELSDGELLVQVQQLVRNERHATATLVAHLCEMERRRLYLQEGCRSLFTYCVQVLHLSEHEAYSRIEAARVALRFPAALTHLATGDVHLTALGLLGPLLTPENHTELLDAAKHQSKREIEELIARLRPRPDVAASVRKLPAAANRVPGVASAPGHTAGPSEGDGITPQPLEPDAGGHGAAGGAGRGEPDVGHSSQPVAGERQAVAGERQAVAGERQAVAGERQAVAGERRAPGVQRSVAQVVPLAPERYKVQFTASAATFGKLRRAQDLLRHRFPDGDVGAVIDQALDLLVQDLEKKKFAATERPRRTDRAAQAAAAVEIPGSAASEAGPAASKGGSAAREAGPAASEASSAASEAGPAASEAGRVARGVGSAAREASSVAREVGSAGSRYIPAAVKRAVWERDGGRCAFVGSGGMRCAERGQLEFDHIHPHADGGGATVENLRLLCRRHNQHAAELFFGVWQAEPIPEPDSRAAGTS